jgi:hypothetical protein
MITVRMAATLAAITLGATLTLAQTPTIAPLRTRPIEKFTVNPGHRDWQATVIAGATIIGGNSSNRGGLFGIDLATGTLKWTFRPTGTASGNPFVATKPAVAGNVVMAPMGNTLVAATIATGREAWGADQTAVRGRRVDSHRAGRANAIAGMVRYPGACTTSGFNPRIVTLCLK